jgi:hypothetical protein
MTVQVGVNCKAAASFIVGTGAEPTIIASDFARKLRLEAGAIFALATISSVSHINQTL